MPAIDMADEKIVSLINQLIDLSGGAKTPFEADLVTQQIQNSLRLLSEGHNTGQLKLITRAMKEMRYAYRIFNEYPEARRISIFGSARTPEDHPNYKMAEEFSRAIAKDGWMSITGAADGIMKAGMAGTAINGSFGLSIRLPFEAPSNKFLEGDPKLIHFRYFFTRKLMFISHSQAAAAFPGGVGTLDELFEILTLMQTGKSGIIPIVLMEAPGETYWEHWEEYMRKNLLDGGLISPEDMSFFFIAPSIDGAIKHIQKFYHRYHSSRYVKDDLVLRLKSPISKQDVQFLNEKFSRLVKSGSIRQAEALPEEEEHENLSRLIFHHTRKDFGLLRQMIDTINNMD